MDNTEKDLKAFSMVMWGVAEDFGGQLSKNGLKMRFLALLDYTIEQITQAGTWLLKNREKSFPAVPTTKEFIDAIKNISGNAQLDNKTKAEIQADVVIEKLNKEGRQGDSNFSDPITHRLMNGQWRYKTWAAEVKTDELTWWKKDFIRIYEAYLDREKAGELYLPLKTNLTEFDSLVKQIVSKKIA